MIIDDMLGVSVCVCVGGLTARNRKIRMQSEKRWRGERIEGVVDGSSGGGGWSQLTGRDGRREKATHACHDRDAHTSCCLNK